MSKHRRQASGPHDYPRTARLNQLVHQIVAEELERIDDERLTLVTVVDVVCEADLRNATVYVTGLGGPEDDEAIVEALGDHRKHLQATINRQTRFKRTPELIFAADEVTRVGHPDRDHPAGPAGRRPAGPRRRDRRGDAGA